jgi:hypothetical protein
MTHEKYLFETFGSDHMKFDEEFTKYLNGRRQDGWMVRDCSYRHESGGGQTMASCLFEHN